MSSESSGDTPSASLDFIREIIAKDVESGKNGGAVCTRFPPEPNGYLHIGHAKAFSLDFGVAEEFGGRCHLRFDDTNPLKEDSRFVEAIKDDITWLGYSWGDNLYYASDYFEKMYDYAVQLIGNGGAYVDDQNAEAISASRGTLTEDGIPSPYRDRAPEESLELFRRMKAGEFGDGEKVLRAKIDMTSSNLNLRDPVMYRIMHATHHRTGDKWCIYPMYDWAHGIEDSIEGITHSLCDLDFENHRPLYDWFLEQLAIHHPQQIEFARLNLSYTVMSKRLLKELIDTSCVSGWDDPRLPTLCGMRRRGYSAVAIRDFCKQIGMTKYNSITDIALLEHCLRSDLNKTSARFMGVFKPLKVVIENYPEGQVEQLDAVNNPEDPSAGTRKVPFSRELYIERADFMEDAPRKFFRLSVGREVRLRYAYFITCVDVIKDEAGEVIELRCTYDPATRGGDAPDGRKVKGTLHWVSKEHAVDAEVRCYDRLFTVENPLGEKGRDFKDFLNPDSLETVTVKAEPEVCNLAPGSAIQFERVGYFCADIVDYRGDRPVFNRTVALRDSWAKKRTKN